MTPRLVCRDKSLHAIQQHLRRAREEAVGVE
jgi:5,10-methylenetetrahydrofolate reductase